MNKQRVKLKDVFDFVFKLVERKAELKGVELKQKISNDIPDFVISDR